VGGSVLRGRVVKFDYVVRMARQVRSGKPAILHAAWQKPGQACRLCRAGGLGKIASLFQPVVPVATCCTGGKLQTARGRESIATLW